MVKYFPKTQPLDKIEEMYKLENMEVGRLLKLRREFIKKSKVPIAVTDNSDGVFSYMLDLYDNHFKSKQKYKQFLEEELKLREDKVSFHNFKDSVINRVINLGILEDINELNMEEYEVKLNSEVKNLGKTLDNQNLNNERLISIDMKQANFNTIKKFSKGKVKEECYEDWVSDLVDAEHFKYRKDVRQVIFGNINPKRVTKLQKNNIFKFVNLVQETLMKPMEVYVLNSDEVIFYYTPELNKLLDNKLKQLSEELGYPLTKEVFDYKYLGRKNFGYVKEILEGDKVKELKFTHVNKMYFAQAYKTYLGEEINDKDLMFELNKEVVKFQYKYTDEDFRI